MFQLYYPLKVWYVTQKFGEVANLAYYKANGIEFTGHNGMDLIVHHGDPIYAAHDGIANFQVDNKGGHGVVIRSNDKYMYEGEMVYMKTIYWHMCDSDKEPQYRSPVEGEVDMPVKVGDLIGFADNTGLSTGDHLHFAVKPMGRNETNGAFYNVRQNNGYMGCIDPAPFLNGLYAHTKTNYKFNSNLKFGDKDIYNDDIKELQKRLQKEGYFPLTQPCTGYYGLKTRKAVLAYQVKHGIYPNWDGFYCGPATRKILNQ